MTLYKLYETVSNLTIGGWLSIVVVLSLFIEITPFIKLNPIAWLGERLNKSMYNRVDKIEGKLDEHIAQSYRNRILTFQDLLTSPLGCGKFTKEQYNEILDTISCYETYCKINNVKNDKCTMAIEYIKACYSECMNKNSFAHLPTTPV